MLLRGAARGPVTTAVFKTVCGAMLSSWVGSTPMSLRHFVLQGKCRHQSLRRMYTGLHISPEPEPSGAIAARDGSRRRPATTRGHPSWSNSTASRRALLGVQTAAQVSPRGSPGRLGLESFLESVCRTSAWRRRPARGWLLAQAVHDRGGDHRDDGYRGTLVYSNEPCDARRSGAGGGIHRGLDEYHWRLRCGFDVGRSLARQLAGGRLPSAPCTHALLAAPAASRAADVLAGHSRCVLSDPTLAVRFGYPVVSLQSGK